MPHAFPAARFFVSQPGTLYPQMDADQRRWDLNHEIREPHENYVWKGLLIPFVYLACFVVKGIESADIRVICG
jgi:hypothetical protein